MFTVGQHVTLSGYGRRGTIIEITEREVVVDWEATGMVQTTPWGDRIDTGAEGHYPHASAGRRLLVVRDV